ncbi:MULTISPECIES: hypothetical protein [Haloferax]|uniref:Uncharacterized protein n=1 Tax=Haloferax marinum TaxID=2666143 RepID=A0A6A8GBI0_9EURY|nr:MULTISPECIES: hypothetical protein [Haloferax]KAB1198479.1 hypothetical protein Hfx1150_13525 [Haloferax sp. CBA1150]MRW97583.1 hypothetical protein [Haloferax marinum]
MATQTTARRLPAGTGWFIGMALGLLFGAVGWWLTREITTLLVIFVATGTALGYSLESTLNPTPLTPRQRRVLLVLLVLGVAVGGVVFLSASIFW